MAEISREKHRERVREAYLKNSFDSMSDSSALELLLFYAIPRKDVKEISYALLNRFGSLDGVFNADIKELIKVEGVGENTAILINLFKNINRRLDLNKNREIKKLDDSNAAMKFVRNELCNLKKEVILVITLDNALNVISVNNVSQGVSNFASVEPYKIMECIFKDGAANVILAHNHPNSDANPSHADIDFTVELFGMCRKVKVNVVDHIIVGENEVISMATDIRYATFFQEEKKEG